PVGGAVRARLVRADAAGPRAGDRPVPAVCPRSLLQSEGGAAEAAAGRSPRPAYGGGARALSGRGRVCPPAPGVTPPARPPPACRPVQLWPLRRRPGYRAAPPAPPSRRRNPSLPVAGGGAAAVAGGPGAALRDAGRTQSNVGPPRGRPAPRRVLRRLGPPRAQARVVQVVAGAGLLPSAGPSPPPLSPPPQAPPSP